MSELFGYDKTVTMNQRIAIILFVKIGNRLRHDINCLISLLVVHLSARHIIDPAPIDINRMRSFDLAISVGQQLSAWRSRCQYNELDAIDQPPELLPARQ